MSKPSECSRRNFLRLGLGIAGGTPLLLSESCGGSSSSPQALPPTPSSAVSQVAIVSCTDYGSSVQTALGQAFSLLGGIGTLVNGKTVTVKINLTNDGRFENQFGRPPGESFITHGATGIALAALLFQNGAQKVRFVDSVGFLSPLSDILTMAQWDVPTLLALGNVELENTRTPNSLYGIDAVSETALGYRSRLHGTCVGWNNNPPPGARTDVTPHLRRRRAHPAHRGRYRWCPARGHSHHRRHHFHEWWRRSLGLQPQHSSSPAY